MHSCHLAGRGFGGGGGVGVLEGEYVLPPLFKEGREGVLHPLFSTFFIEKLDPPRGGDPFPRDALRIPATGDNCASREEKQAGPRPVDAGRAEELEVLCRAVGSRGGKGCYDACNGFHLQPVELED